jgi:hypothetical protein
MSVNPSYTEITDRRIMIEASLGKKHKTLDKN